MDYKVYVETLLNIRWLQKSDEIIELFHNFILNLLTSQSEFARICLTKILSQFIPTDNEVELWINGEPKAEFSKKLEMVHKLNSKLMEIIPMLPVTMRRIIPELFPYYKQNSAKLAAYIHNIMKILDYCPNMMHDILEVVFEK